MHDDEVRDPWADARAIEDAHARRHAPTAKLVLAMNVEELAAAYADCCSECLATGRLLGRLGVWIRGLPDPDERLAVLCRIRSLDVPMMIEGYFLYFIGTDDGVCVLNRFLDDQAKNLGNVDEQALFERLLELLLLDMAGCALYAEQEAHQL